MSGQRKYSMELRERATRMALEARADPSRRKGAIKRIGGQLGINPEALRTWVRAVEQGGRNERGEISDQEARIRALEAENRVSSPGFCGGLFRPLPFVLLCVGFLLVAV